MLESHTKQEISVSSGEVHACRAEGVLRASAIGSCVVVAAYDAGTGAGGMAHVMLPGTSPNGGGTNRTRYAGDAIGEMMRGMTALGARANEIGACLVGGANVLGEGHDTPGPEIVRSLVQLLDSRGIRRVAEDVGGVERRSCTLDVSCGRTAYTVGDSAERVLWQAAEGMSI